MLKKSSVLKSIKELPDKFSIEEIIDHLILLQKIDLGVEQSNSKKVVSTNEAKVRLGKWLK